MRELGFGISYSDIYSDNTISTNKYPLLLIPFLTIGKYFRKYENFYFLLLSIIQLLTLGPLPSHYSPTGPYSTSIPLILCVIMEIIINCTKWIKNKYYDWKENHKLYQYLKINKNDKKLIYKYNYQIYPGDIIRLVKNEICSVDGLVIDSSDPNAKVNLSAITGEPKLQYISKIFPEKSLNDYYNNAVLRYDRNNFEINFRDRFYTITDGFIHSGTLIKSDWVYVWVICVGNKKKYQFKNNHNPKTSTIDDFVSKYMNKISIPCLIFSVLIMTIVHLMKISDHLYISTIIATIIQFWILFNGIIPFSVKILLIFARTIQSIRLTGINIFECNCNEKLNNIIVNDVLQIDDFGKIKYAIFDKTGTITTNKFNITSVSTFNSDKIYKSDQLLVDINNQFYRCLCLCINQNDRQFDTMEDEAIRDFSLKLGFKINSSDKFVEININDDKNLYQYIDVPGLEFTHDRKMSSRIVMDDNNYYIYSKGSIDIISQKISTSDKNLLMESEKKFIDKYPGHRLMALAYKKLSHDPIKFDWSSAMSGDVFEQELTYLGMIAIQDELRPNTNSLVRKLVENNISVCLASGDRKSTVVHMAEQAGIIHYNYLDVVDYNDSMNITNHTLVINGNFIKEKKLKDLCILLSKFKNFVGHSMTPNDKMKLVMALRTTKKPVLAIGDGFNDLPMFQKANISVAIRSHAMVEKSADYAIRELCDLSTILDYSSACYQRNSFLINLTFYRCVIITFLTIINCIYQTDSHISPLFDGFVTVAFNFAWTLPGLLYFVLDVPIDENKKRTNILFRQMQQHYRTNFTFTNIWSIFAIVMSIWLFFLTYLLYDSDFRNVLTLTIIFLLNNKLANYCCDNFSWRQNIFAWIGIINYLIYIYLTSGIFNHNIWYYIFVFIISNSFEIIQMLII